MKSTKILLAIFVSASLLMASCQKEKTVEPNDQNTTELQQLSNDEQNVEESSDEALNDADIYLSSAKATEELVCNATVDSMVTANDSVTFYIRYHGNNCTNTLNRTGNMTIRHRVGEHWWAAGTTAIIRLIDFHVIMLSNNSSLTMNGVHYYQNVSGNNATTIIHKVWGYINTSYSDNTSSVWNVARQKSLTGTLGTLIFTMDGFGTSGEMTNLVAWGTHRNGHAFYTQIGEIITLKQACGWKPCSGTKIHSIPAENKSATVTFGYNDNNKPIGPEECPTKYRLDWQHNGNSGTLYLPL